MICRICDSEDLVPVVDLGLQPWANHFLTREEVGTEPHYPLRLIYCRECHCVQLDYTVPKETMFADHTYVSGTTTTLARHFADTARMVDRELMGDRPGKSILDIGSNDGTQLLQYKDLGYDVLGVESCGRIADLAEQAGVPTVKQFFNLDTARGIGRKFDLVNASGVFFHLEELHSVTEAVRESLQSDGVFLVQFLYMKSIVENMAFDQIYHEHLLYYTLETIERLLRRHGLASFDAVWSPIHGGSMMLMAGHEGARPRSRRLEQAVAEEAQAGINEQAAYEQFAHRIVEMKERTVGHLDRAKEDGKTIFGMGAPVKGNTLLNYCGIGPRHLDCLVERNPLRKGLFSPGMHLPIVIEDELEAPPDLYFVLAWNFKKEILKRNQDLIEQGVEFFFPVEPRVS